MSQLERRFEIAHERARAGWAAADPLECAARAGCVVTPEGTTVPYFNRLYRVLHPSGDVALPAAATTAAVAPAHPSIAIVVLHYLLTADGIPPAEGIRPAPQCWLTFRQLPNGLFYAQAFASHAEGLLAGRFGADAEAFRRAAQMVGGRPLTTLPAAGLVPPSVGLVPPDAAYRFQAFPRLALVVQLWEGDEEFPGRSQVLFDAHAGHYLPTEDLSGIGDWLAHKLAAA